MGEQTGIRKNFILRNRADCKPQYAVMVGDRTDNDIVPAKAIGMETIWINLSEILEIVQTNFPK